VKNEGGKIYFSRFFMILKPCIDGFLNGCRPYLSIDSTFLNGKWNGQLAGCTALDGHNWMFPLAFGFFASETEDNWTWFMQQLHRAIGHLQNLAICTDACKGLENAVKKVFPQAEQRECFRHLMENFKKKFHGDVFGRMWPAAKAYRVETFNYHMAKIFEAKSEVGTYLSTYHNLKWMRCDFNTEIKCDYIHTGKPCDHALAFLIGTANTNFHPYVHHYYSVCMFRAAYAGEIEPITDKSQWPQVTLGFEMEPPISKRPIGRQRKLRIKGCLEDGGTSSKGKKKLDAKGKEQGDGGEEKAQKNGGKGNAKEKKRFGTTNRCKKCGELGHRKTTCPENEPTER
jgi:hypothetical protein